MPNEATEPCRVSIVVPVFNEAANLAPLVEQVHEAFASSRWAWELLIVDDGSEDGTSAELESLRRKYGDHLRPVVLRRNFGQTAAMQAGIDAARGTVIATLDGDLQNDPADIPGMVERLLSEDRDLVAGWRKDRKDGFWLRRLPSLLANRLIRWMTRVNLHDYGCSLKVFRGDVIRDVRLYGEMHRFIPAWLATQTAPGRICEQVVAHRPRGAGQSNYGLMRTFRVLIDLVVVFFFMRYNARPGHFFGALGFVLGFAGSATLGYLLLLKFMGEDIGTRPLFMVGILCIVLSVQMFTTAVLSELLSRTYYHAAGRRSYILRSEADSDAPWRPPEAT